MMDTVYIPKPILDLVRDQPFELDSVGHSGSKILLFSDKVLKIQPYSRDTVAEYEMMKWLENKLPVPKCLYHLVENDTDYLLMSRIAGKMSCDDEYMTDAQTVVKILADGLKRLWQVDIKACPMNRTLESKLAEAKKRVDAGLCDIEDWKDSAGGAHGFNTPMELYNWLSNNRPNEELVFSHGDYCLPNIFVKEHELSGFIDLGHSGVADKWHDIALCYRSLIHNSTGKFSEKTYDGFDLSLLFCELGVEPDWEKINYYILLDELF